MTNRDDAAAGGIIRGGAATSETPSERSPRGSRAPEIDLAKELERRARPGDLVARVARVSVFMQQHEEVLGAERTRPARYPSVAVRTRIFRHDFDSMFRNPIHAAAHKEHASRRQTRSSVTAPRRDGAAASADGFPRILASAGARRSRDFAAMDDHSLRSCSIGAAATSRASSRDAIASRWGSPLRWCWRAAVLCGYA